MRLIQADKGRVCQDGIACKKPGECKARRKCAVFGTPFRPDLAATLTDACALIDGFKQGESWSAWDEDVRLRLGEALRDAVASGTPRDGVTGRRDGQYAWERHHIASPSMLVSYCQKEGLKRQEDPWLIAFELLNQSQAKDDAGSQVSHTVGLLQAWTEAFRNSGETTSLHEWNERLKAVNQRTRDYLYSIAALPPEDSVPKTGYFGDNEPQRDE